MYQDSKDIIEADVVVVGGGSAGVGASIAAARKGLSVYLIEPSDLLGGIVAKSFGMPVDSAYPRGKSIGGICEEWLNSLYEYNPPAAKRRVCLLPGFDDGSGREVVYDPDVAVFQLFELTTNAGVNVLLNATATDVVMDGDRVKSVIYHDRAGSHTINAKVVIDCSGDGDIAAKAGVPFQKGDKDGKMMGATLTFFMKNVDVEKVFEGLEDPFRMELAKKGVKMGKIHEDIQVIYIMPGHRRDTVYFNSVHIKGIDGTNPTEMRNGTIEARKRAYQLAQFAVEEIPGFENAEVESMAPALGVRETRRFEGVYELTKEDLLNGEKFEDGVVCCDATIDDVYRGESKVYHTSLIDRGVYYQVPYRSLCPKEIENVLFAGRCLSADTFAFASVRGISTSMAMGQACGTAAHLTIRDNTTVQNVDYEELVKELKEQGVNGIGGEEL